MNIIKDAEGALLFEEAKKAFPQVPLKELER